MTEKEEKKNEMKNQMKNQEQTNPKPSLWQRMKKPLAAGLLGASLLVTPMKRADAIYLVMRPPPKYHIEEVEKDKLLKIGWQILIDYWNGTKGDEKDLELAKKIFENVYKRTKNPLALKLNNVRANYSAVEKKTYKESKEELLNVLKFIEERLETYPDDIDFVGDKQLFLKAIFDASYNLYFNKGKYRKYRREDEMDLYYQDAIEFGKKLIEFEKKLLNQKELKDYIRSEPKKLTDDERDGILDYIKRDLLENETMYKELVKEKD